MLEQHLAHHMTQQGKENQSKADRIHSSSSILPTGLATMIRPAMTKTIPTQRLRLMSTPRNNQQPSGTSTWTTFASMKAMFKGKCLSTYIQQRKLRMRPMIPNHTHL